MSYLFGSDVLPTGKVDNHPGTVNGDLTAAEWNATMAAIDDIKATLKADMKYLGFAQQTNPALADDAKARVAMKVNELMVSISGRAYVSLMPRYVDVREFTGALSPGADATAAVQAAVDAAVARGVRRVHFPEGEYFFNAHGSTGPGDSSNSYRVLIPTRFQVTGEGEGRSILWHINVNSDNYEGGVGADDLFRVADGSHYVTFRGLHFKGENGDNDGNGFVHTFNSQNSFICTLIVNTSDVTVADCYFQNAFGFSFHDPGENARVHAHGCTHRWMANGLNVNANWSLQLGNTFVNSEGIEAGGKYIVLANNNYQDAIGVGISCGGNQGETNFPGAVVIGNSINGSTACGIVIADNCVDAVFANNTIRECALGGLVVPGSGIPNGSPRNISFMGNVFIDNCADPSLGSIVGFDIRTPDGGAHAVVGNVSRNIGTTGYVQRYAFHLDAPDCMVSGNIFEGTEDGKDASYAPNSTNTLVGPNLYVKHHSEWESGSSMAIDKRTVADFDAWREMFRISAGSGGDDYHPYAETWGGRKEWGRRDIPALRDTFIDRLDPNGPAAGLKLTGKFCATLGIGVGNSASASTPGAVVKKIEVFDASGASLGFVAVYDAIT